MVCKYCNKEMRLDDVDAAFPNGSKDNYWVCDNCQASATEYIRNKVAIRVDWYEED
jgi:hypothetical protein